MSIEWPTTIWYQQIVGHELVISIQFPVLCMLAAVRVWSPLGLKMDGFSINFDSSFCSTPTISQWTISVLKAAWFIMVVLFYPDISNFTFWNVKNLKCKNFLIDFLDELGNFKQKNFYTSKCKFFLHFTTTDPYFFLRWFTTETNIQNCPLHCLITFPDLRYYTNLTLLRQF